MDIIHIIEILGTLLVGFVGGFLVARNNPDLSSHYLDSVKAKLIKDLAAIQAKLNNLK